MPHWFAVPRPRSLLAATLVLIGCRDTAPLPEPAAKSTSEQPGSATSEPAPTTAKPPSVPVPFVAQPIEAVAVATAELSACVLTNTGEVACLGTVVDRAADLERGQWPARAVPELSDVTAIDIHEHYACGLTRAGELWCWGSDPMLPGSFDTLVAEHSDEPHRIEGLPPLVQFELGSQHGCGRTATGEVWCWGRALVAGRNPDYGAIGPATKLDIEGAIDVAYGTTHGCAVTDASQVYCWGHPLPLQHVERIAGVGSALEVELGWGHACVRSRDGDVRCWTRWEDDEGPRVLAKAAERMRITGDFGVCTAAREGEWTCRELAQGTELSQFVDSEPDIWPDQTFDLDKYMQCRLNAGQAECRQRVETNEWSAWLTVVTSPPDPPLIASKPACRSAGQATDAACDFAHPPVAPALPTDAVTDTATGTSCGPVFTALSETANALRFVGLSGGRFTRGAQVRQRVAVSRFAIAESELTVAQYRELMGIAPKCGTYLRPRACVDQEPVHSVTWREAIALANALTRRENARLPPDQQLCECYDELTGWFDRACTGYRLPTQAEWDYAVGDVPDRICDHAWIDGCERRRGNPDLHEVMTKLPNQFGLFDMHGNAREWVYDAYSRHESSEPAVNPIDDGRRHTARRWRGSWVETNIDELDAANDEAGGDGTREFLGLRLARGPLPH